MLLSGFVNPSDWPLCSCAQQICLWLATMINAQERLKAHRNVWIWKREWECLKAGVYQQTGVYLSKRSIIDIYLQHVFEALIIVANYRHIWWARERNGQSEVFTNLLNSVQSVSFGDHWFPLYGQVGHLLLFVNMSLHLAWKITVLQSKASG